MRVVLFTADEPLYLPRYVEPILDAHADDVARVVVAPFPASTPEQVREYRGMYGLRAGSRMALRYARGHALDALSRHLGRRPTGRHHSVAAVARAHGVPVERVSDVTDPRFVDDVRTLDPDVLLSVVAGQRLPAALRRCADEAINLHGSLLPEYRGRATAFWPLYFGDDRTGVTAHLMTDEFDAGPILARRAFPLEASDTVDSVYRKLAATGARLGVDVLEWYPDLPDPRPNESTPGDYYGLPTAAERRTFRERGGAFL